MGNFVDIAGERYGKLVALYPANKKTKHGASIWIFQCDCGNKKEAPSNSVRIGLIKSCGCMTKTHGGTGTRLYQIWCNMRYRCENPKTDKNNRYCNRGISVCGEWHSYEKFREWALKNGYNDSLTIDRIDNDKDYSPDNCRWATWKEQANNTSRNRRVTIGGVEKPIKDWCKEYGISEVTVYRRVRQYSMPYDVAITIPPIKRNNPLIVEWLRNRAVKNGKN